MLHQPFSLEILQKYKIYNTTSLFQSSQKHYFGIHSYAKQQTNCRHLDHTTSFNKHIPIHVKNYFIHKVMTNYTIVDKNIRYIIKGLFNCLKYCGRLTTHQKCQWNYTGFYYQIITTFSPL